MFCFLSFYSSLSAFHLVVTLAILKFTSLSVCLLLISGLQGDILTVIRRVDEHWIEAKLGDKVGICPLQFTEVGSLCVYLFVFCFFLSSLMNVGYGFFSVMRDTCRFDHFALIV